MFDPDTSYISEHEKRNRIKSSIFASPSITIIVLCVISFFMELLLGNPYILALHFDPTYLFSRPWTLVTYIFIHAGLFHLLFNMIVLYYAGTTLERRASNRQFLLIFFVSGILSAIGYTVLSQPTFGIAQGLIGASGAVYGVLAALTVLEPDLRVYLYFAIPMKLKYFLLLVALFDFLMINSSDMIAHTAHLSGLFVGLYMGYQIKKREEKYLRSRYTGRW